MRKLLTILTILSLAFAAVGATAEGSSISLGYIAWQMADLRCACSAMAFEYAASQNGATVTRMDAENDAEKALAAVESLIEAKIDGIVIYAYSLEQAQPLLDAAKAASIPVVLENVDVSGIIETQDYIIGVGSASSDRSYAAAKYLAQVQGGTTLFHCAGPEGSSLTQAYTDGLSQAESELGSIDLAGTLNGNGSVADGAELTNILINSYTEFDSILADSDAMAQGSRQSIQSAGYKGIEIASVGNSPDALTLVENGTLSAVATSPSAIQGVASFKFLQDYLVSGAVPEVCFQPLPALTVSADDLEAWANFDAYAYAYDFVYSGEPLETFDLEAMEAQIAADLAAQPSASPEAKAQS